MSIGNAIHFIHKVQSDSAFRNEIYDLSGEDIPRWLAEHQMAFSDDEYEESYNYLHVRCQDEYEAQELKQLRQWYYLARGS